MLITKGPRDVVITCNGQPIEATLESAYIEPDEGESRRLAPISFTVRCVCTCYSWTFPGLAALHREHRRQIRAARRARKRRRGWC